jgi:hypothetical protein
MLRYWDYVSALLVLGIILFMIFHEKPHLIHHDFGYVGRFSPKKNIPLEIKP